MNTSVQIFRPVHTKDTDGFATTDETVLACVRAYFEQRHGNVRWANRAAFSEATALFRFRVIPGVAVQPLYVLVCAAGRFEVLSVEVIRDRYVELLAKEVEPVGNHEDRFP